MLLQGIRAGIPIAIFSTISVSFLVVQINLLDLIRWNYNAVHLLFGLAAPLPLGYLYAPAAQIKIVPLRVFLNRARTIAIRRWPLEIYKSAARDFRNGTPWSQFAGALLTFLLSVWNEAFIDPKENGIPFTHAYENFIADTLGILLFITACHFVTKRNPTVCPIS